MIKLIQGDCLNVMKKMKPNCIDSIVTDPPAGIAFMGKKWDHDKGGRKQWIAWMEEVATECLRVLKPGGHALVWAIPRTSHWTATAWENAGFEVRDCVYHVFGSGFPKSHNLSKAMDRMAGVKRDVTGIRTDGRGASPSKLANHGKGDTGIGHADGSKQKYEETCDTSEDAKIWSGWGTALKPAVECWWLLRKPLSEKTIAANALKWGTGGINIDGCRVEYEKGGDLASNPSLRSSVRGGNGGHIIATETQSRKMIPHSQERFPANLIHDGSEEVLEQFPNTKSGGGDKHGRKPSSFCASTDWEKYKGTSSGGDQGSAARFFYCAKASKKDRNDGCGDLKSKKGIQSRLHGATTKGGNNHPTVKPLELMKYLCRLITPPEGIILDPFMGSGSTGKAAIFEDFHFIGIEMEIDYITIAKKRIAHAKKQRGNNELNKMEI